MGLQYYIDAFSSLKMNRAQGNVSPHKVCMLLAVMDLVERGKISDNRIYLDQQIKSQFTKHFEQLQTGYDQDTPYLSYYHLRTSAFWHHKVREGKEGPYKKLQESNSENKTLAAIEYVHVDPELFEYFKSYNARESLKAALADNFNEELRNKLLVPIRGWSWTECEVIVNDYFEMLEAELKDQRYNKAEHNRKLQNRLNNRNKQAIEQKHQNISAILKEMGMPTIDGYKPLPHYQKNILTDVIGAQLATKDDITSHIEKSLAQPEEIPSVDDILDRMVEFPNERKVREPTPKAYKAGSYQPKKYNYIAREANNVKLGLAGEKFIVNYEKARLIYIGKESLSERIDHVSQDDDTAGYDIHSYETNGADRFIEVKTTRYARFTQFFVSPNELNTSKLLEKKYHLYRVFNFKSDPRFFVCRGYLKDNFLLEPSTFIASVQ